MFPTQDERTAGWVVGGALAFLVLAVPTTIAIVVARWSTDERVAQYRPGLVHDAVAASQDATQQQLNKHGYAVQQALAAVKEAESSVKKTAQTVAAEVRAQKERKRLELFNPRFAPPERTRSITILAMGEIESFHVYVARNEPT
jgi:hypothetical protein